MKKITDYNYNLLTAGSKSFLKEMIDKTENDPNHFLGNVVIINWLNDVKLVDVESVTHLHYLYVKYLNDDFKDLLPLTECKAIKRLLEIFDELGVSVE